MNQTTRTPSSSAERNTTATVIAFTALVFVLSVPFYLLISIAHSGRHDASHLLMWAPAVAALICVKFFGFDRSILGFGFPAIRFSAWGFFLPICYGVICYVALWLTGFAPLIWSEYAASASSAFGLGGWSPWIAIGMTLTTGLLDHLPACAGEEIGWRGFLVPVLARRLGFFGVALTSGLIWAVWHMPAILFAGYSSEAPIYFELICFTIMIISTGGIAAWLRLKSGSIWPCVIFHACHNTLIQVVLDPMTFEHGRSAYYATEFGAGLAVNSLLLLICICVIDRKSLSKASVNAMASRSISSRPVRALTV